MFEGLDNPVVGKRILVKSRGAVPQFRFQYIEDESRNCPRGWWRMRD